MNLSGPGLILVGRLLITASISELVICLYRDLTSFYISLGRVHVPRNVSISSRFSSLFWIEVCIVFSDGNLYFCGISGDVLFIIFYCIYLILLSFLL